MTSKPISTSQLTGIALAYAVGHAMQRPMEILPSEYGSGPRLFVIETHGLRPFRPDRDPGEAWALFCRYGQQARLELHFHYNGASCLQAGIRTGHTADRMVTAGLRAMVTHLHGQAIEIPIQLLDTEQQEGAA
ncbi:hypothetical protein CXF92_18705 [Pseudomonas sp. Choline-3u-10]|mgnify:CR=1 FL=1|uniref:DUF2591 domain-containing protein n=1 Tax=viral metagenome TaxID=1070528 RepID=A0A6M3XAJ1_9ZZZZ|nr:MULTISPECIES: hypothetical protein [Pseudomonadaceae]MBK3797506.1 hypothetical protein [Stutzerimonas stutzeri]MBK3876345.1 hypothetical protein [Stutzerimonas stutzeri]PKG90942.1 hypothetical protein CXF92_18705 [Pseudomonas sp. Choline-3u-10]|tara:strand:+ start:873 stop:1271 length:399 start_codon:yes stop_codon:yes gene_type:complete